MFTTKGNEGREPKMTTTMAKLKKIEAIDQDTDERYMIDITWTTGIDHNGNRVKVIRYEKGERWAEVVNNLKYAISGRSNAKVKRDNGSVTTYTHVENAKSAAMKYVNGGNWDFDPGYNR